MHELKMSIEKMNMEEKTLLCWVEQEIAKGKECFDVEQCGQVTDMIKDLAEAKEKCVKAKYYEYLLSVMTESDNSPESERFGYDNWRYSSGRYAPKGHGHRSGYVPELEMYEGDEGELRMGYPHIRSPHMSSARMGYNPMMDGEWPRHGKFYEEYRDARRHYTETKDEKHKRLMNEKIEEHVEDTMETLREMWKDADPEMKKRMKMNMKDMLEDFEHMG